MRVGDLVRFNPGKNASYGALTAVKYFQRLKNMVNDRIGIIASISGKNCCILFGDETIVLNKEYIEVVSEISS